MVATASDASACAWRACAFNADTRLLKAERRAAMTAPSTPQSPPAQLRLPPVPSARSRASRCCRLRVSAAISPNSDALWVSSSRASNWPAFTRSPERTINSSTTAGSLDWMSCTLEDGMTAPAPRVTSSTSAISPAQTRKATNTPVTSNTMRRAALPGRGARLSSALMKEKAFTSGLRR